MNENEYVYQHVARLVKEYPYGVGRTTIAARLGVTKSTAQGHLEKCVRLGLLRKFYGWLSRSSRGWVYIDPAQAPDPLFVEVLDEEEWTDEAFQDQQAKWEQDQQRPGYIPTKGGAA